MGSRGGFLRDPNALRLDASANYIYILGIVIQVLWRNTVFFFFLCEHGARNVAFKSAPPLNPKRPRV